MLANQVAVASDYLVVVPVTGKKASEVSVTLGQSELPAGVVGLDYPGFNFNTALRVTGDPTFTGAGTSWGVSSGALPAGLALSANGVLSGIPGDAAVGSAPFEVAATVNARTARQTYQVSVSSLDAPEQAPTPAAASGTGAVKDGDAQLTVSPTKLSVGQVVRQLPAAPMTVNISNTGTAAAAVRINQPDKPEYQVTDSCPDSLLAGDSCQATVVFTPSTSSTLKSSFNVGLGSQAVTVSLDGAGRDSQATFTHLPSKKSYQDLGVVAKGQLSVGTTLIKNTSQYYPLVISSAAVTGTYAAQFGVENDCPPVLQVGETCSVSPSFAPTQDGNLSATMRLNMNVSGGYRNVTLSGKAAGDLGVSSLSSYKATLGGGGTVYVYGAGFLPDAKVVFGTTDAKTTWNSTSSLTAVVPPVTAPETTWVSVVNPDGTTATAAKPFARATSFVNFSVDSVDFGKYALNVQSPYKSVSLRNSATTAADTFTISDLHISGPFELNTNSGYCSKARVVGAGGSCTLSIRFKPTDAGMTTGELTVEGNGTSLTLPLSGTGLNWAGTPSGSVSANTDVPYETTLSGNVAVGGAAQSKTIDIFFRNTDPNAQVAASFELEGGAAFQFYTIYAVNEQTSYSNPGCITSARTTGICQAATGLPHLRMRLTVSSNVGLGTYTDNLIVKDAAGVEQFRIPLTLDVVYDVSAEAYASTTATTPVSAVTVEKAPLATEGYTEVFLRNMGTQGMLRTNSVSLQDNSADLYLKSDSVARVNAKGTVSTCGKFVSANQITGCLSDDIQGGNYPHQRVRVYYKLMSQGQRTATLRFDHSGQGQNPLDVPLSITPTTLDAFWSANPVSGEVVAPGMAIPGNYELTGAAVNKPFYVYLNSSDGTPLNGYIQLSGDGVDVLTGPALQTASNTGNKSVNCGWNGDKSKLCTAAAAYPNFVFSAVVKGMTLGDHVFTLTFLDPAMNEQSRVDVTVSVVNDATPVASSTLPATTQFPNGVVDFGATTAPTAPGMVGSTLAKTIFVRNDGTLGAMKVTGAVIDDGGAGAFKLTGALMKTNPSGTSTTCSSALVSTQEVSGCLAGEASTANSYPEVQVLLSYTPTAGGLQSGNLLVYHNSTTVPNPMIVPLTGTGIANLIAGDFSGSNTASTTPNAAISSGTTGSQIYVRNLETQGALYVDAWFEGDDAGKFTFYSVSSSTSNCASYSSTAMNGCLMASADSKVGSKNFTANVRCNAGVKGTKYPATLHVRTQGAEYTLPMVCTSR